MAASAKEGFSEMLKIVCSMLSRNECMVFREPVDWKGLGLLDYPEIVLRPMDLGTIKKRIENDDYNAVEDIATDVRLVWSNCMLYNRDGSEVSLTFAFITKFTFFDLSTQFLPGSQPHFLISAQLSHTLISDNNSSTTWPEHLLGVSRKLTALYCVSKIAKLIMVEFRQLMKGCSSVTIYSKLTILKWLESWLS